MMTLILENLIRLLDEFEDLVASFRFRAERLFVRTPKERRRTPRLNLLTATQAS